MFLLYIYDKFSSINPYFGLCNNDVFTLYQINIRYFISIFTLQKYDLYICLCGAEFHIRFRLQDKLYICTIVGIVFVSAAIEIMVPKELDFLLIFVSRIILI